MGLGASRAVTPLAKPGVMVALAAAAAVALVVGMGAPASAAGAHGTVLDSSCQRLQGLTDAVLCVSVQPAASSIQPGGAASYGVGVSVSGGSALDVTVSLDGSAGGAVFTSGCPGGNGSAKCWILSLGLLSPSSYQMQAQVPAGAAGTSVTLSATASVPTLLPWTPPSAAGSVMVATPPQPGKSPSPSASATRPSRGSPSPSQSSSSPHGSPTAHVPSSGSSGSSGSRGASGSVGANGASGPVGATGSVGSVGFTGSFPQLTTTGQSDSIVGPGSANGLFPTVGPASSQGAPGSTAAQPGTQRLEAAAYKGGLPLAPVGLAMALVLSAVWGALTLPGWYRRRRAAPQATDEH